jgi:hypothetical protein
MEGDFIVAGNFIAEGKIDNDALVSPVRPAAMHQSVSNFGLATGDNVMKAADSLTVPAGFSSALVTAHAMVSAYNNGGAAWDALYCFANIVGDTEEGWSSLTDVSASRMGSAVNTSTALLTGLTPGDAITVEVKSSTGSTNWSSYGGNVANIDATVLWLR